MQNSEDNEIVRVSEIAAMTGKPMDTIRWYRHRQTAGHNEGPRMFKLGRNVVAKRADVVAWIASQYAESNGPVDKYTPSERALLMASFQNGVGRKDESRYSIAESTAEAIAQAIEREGLFEGPRAQRIIKMCAGIARRTATPHSYPAFRDEIRRDLTALDGRRRTNP